MPTKSGSSTHNNRLDRLQEKALKYIDNEANIGLDLYKKL